MTVDRSEQIQAAVTTLHANPVYGESPAEREKNIRKWRVISLIWGGFGIVLTLAGAYRFVLRPPVELWLWTLIALFPAITFAAGLSTRRRLWIMTDDRDISSVPISAAIACLLPLDGLTVRIEFLNTRLLLIIGGIAAAIIASAYFLSALGGLGGARSKPVSFIFYAAVVGIMYSYGLVGPIDAGWDRNPTANLTAQVTSPRMDKVHYRVSDTGARLYFLEVTVPASGQIFDSLLVTKRQYEESPEGSAIKLERHPGLIGIPWVSVEKTP
ncbi:MAG: hypothetical protein JWM33_683 [Caulobacteraceae bacterium]|nr:hypothetical protein [Caulobacteraceae bacterium]